MFGLEGVAKIRKSNKNLWDSVYLYQTVIMDPSSFKDGLLFPFLSYNKKENVLCQNYQWWDSNRGPMMLDANALPIEAPPLPFNIKEWLNLILTFESWFESPFRRLKIIFGVLED